MSNQFGNKNGIKKGNRHSWINFGRSKRKCIICGVIKEVSHSKGTTTTVYVTNDGIVNSVNCKSRN